MRVRHRTPSIFSLSMVDMLCCALGCVILVWLLNAKQAEDDAEEQRDEIAALRQAAENERDQLRRQIQTAEQEQRTATERVSILTRERDQARREREDLESRSKDMETQLSRLKDSLKEMRTRSDDLTTRIQKADGRIAQMEIEAKTATSRLTEEQRKTDQLSKQLDIKEEKLSSGRKDLARREAEVLAAEKRLEEMRKSRDSDKERMAALARTIESREEDKKASEAGLRKTLANLDQLKGDLADREKAMAAALRRQELLEKQLGERQAALAAAEKKADQLVREKESARKNPTVEDKDTRFAGIELTGKRVLFLVDTSGSMEMVDDKTEAPRKWEEVRQTVARLMRSLPRLEKYQLICFSTVPIFPLQGENQWLDYDPNTSPNQVLKAMETIKPKGGTNMYTAIEDAFRFRKAGMDTIYLLSDGLPNQGEGLTAEETKTLRGIARGTALGKHVRTTLLTKWNAPQPGLARVRIHTIGFFYESPDLGSFLWALSRENEGSFVGMSQP